MLRLTVLLLTTAIRLSITIDASEAPRWRAARLAAQVTLRDPVIGAQLRQVAERIVGLVGALETELDRFRLLEERFELAVHHVEASTPGEHVDDELFVEIAERFGVLRVRPALDRLEQAHPDAPTTDRH